MPNTIRQNKVSHQIQRIVALVLQRDIADPRVDGLVTVTRVEVTRDLREAKVYLSILAAKRPDATVVEGIKSAGRHIQAEVAQELPLRFAPRLSFHLDDSLKRQADILKVIKENAGAPAAEEPGQTPDAAPKSPHEEGNESP